MESWMREAEPDTWEESVSTGCFSRLSMPVTHYRSTAIIESLHEITEIAQMSLSSCIKCDYKDFLHLFKVVRDVFEDKCQI